MTFATDSSLQARYLQQSSPALLPFYEKVMAGERFTREEGLALYASTDLLGLGILADAARVQRHPEAANRVWWVHNYHINPTNICEDTCRFCSFKKGPQSPHAYFWTIDKILADVAAYPFLSELREFHIVGGHYEHANTAYYAALFSALREAFPHVNIKALTAAEIDYLAKIDGLDALTVLQTLKDAGLQALPGGGAEVFSPRVRAAMCPDKIPAERWLEIHGMAHALGLPSNATMLAGLGETEAERVDHLLQLRQQQDVSGGFLSFIPLNCYYEGNKADEQHALSGFDNLKNFAVARLLLDNVPHIKGFWVHMGEKIAQVGLHFGVDDVDGTVVQEKIAHAAGTQSAQGLSKRQLLHLIHQAGRVAVERDAFYNEVKVWDAEALADLIPAPVLAKAYGA